MNWTLILDGVVLSVLGVATTFTALGLFILIMVVLRRLFPNVEEKAARAALKASDETSPAALVETAEADDGAAAAAIGAALLYWQGMLGADEEEQVAAAIAVSLFYLGRQVQAPVPQVESRLGANLERGRGRWWQSGAAGES